MQKSQIHSAFDKGEGILQFKPCWIPRPFNQPGRRLKLHPDDYFALGLKRGAIVERWFSSLTRVITSNSPQDEGLSYVNTDNTENGKVLFGEVVEELGAQLIGEELKSKYGTWPMFAKFFDYQLPLFHHVHHGDEAAALVGMNPKPEHYYFPPQYNNHFGDFPLTYFGIDPSVSKEEVLDCLKNFNNFDTRITELSRAYRLQIGTGWYTPPMVLHAPGSLLTYEPQWNSDAMSIWENVVAGEIMNENLLISCIPEEKQQDMEFIFSLIDWEKNICSDFRSKYFRPPVTATKDESHEEKWVCYGNDYIGSKELTIYPGKEYTSKDDAAYGCIVTQGYGQFGTYHCEAANMIRYDQFSADEYFVSEETAKRGVKIVNNAKYENLVILKHFGPNCGMPTVPAQD